MCETGTPQASIDKKRISDLVNLPFRIPSYQRGYRWDEQQAEDLLKDLETFATNTQNKDKVYCLQPLVVSKIVENDTSYYRVVDGQQRLTTIYLIIKKLQSFKEKSDSLSEELKNIIPDNLYSIEYDRGKKYEVFLNNISSPEKDYKQNVDFYHMNLVYNKIDWWIENIDSDTLVKFIEVLLGKAYFIWYEIDKLQEIKTFTRLNIGKIPLTDAELVKALFLNRSNFALYNNESASTAAIHKIANEWNTIENALQNDEFWLFIHNRYYKKPTRIDFILELMSKNDAFQIKEKLGKQVLSHINDNNKKDLNKNKQDVSLFLKHHFDSDHQEDRLLLQLTKQKSTSSTEYENKLGETIYNQVGNVKIEDNNLLKFLFKNKYKRTKDNYEKSTDSDKKSYLSRFMSDKIIHHQSELKSFLNKERLSVLAVSLTSLRDEFIENYTYNLLINNKDELDGLLGQCMINSLLSDEHGIFRYFNQVFLFNKYSTEEEWTNNLWSNIKKYYDIFNEWYNDYKIYHYIGYLVAVKRGEAEDFINECIKLWKGQKAKFEYADEEIQIAQKEKDCFINELRKEIVYKLENDKGENEVLYRGSKKRNFIRDLINAHHNDKLNTINGLKNEKKEHIADYLYNMNFEQKADPDKKKKDGYSKRCCVNWLLLHNVELSIQYNDKLVNNNRYNLPYFSRFPFHLYNSDNWDVEHIRPNAGDAINKEEERILYLLFANRYYDLEKTNNTLFEEIEKYVNSTEDLTIDYNKIDSKIEQAKKQDKPHKYLDDIKKRDDNGEFVDICEEIDKLDYSDKSLTYKDKNKIYNYTLLDSSTNREYGNHIFPYKRAYIAEKEKGRKLCYAVVEKNEPEPGKALNYKLVDTREIKEPLIEILWIYEKTTDANLKADIIEYLDTLENKRTYGTNKKDIESKLKDFKKRLTEELESPNICQFTPVYIPNAPVGTPKFKLEETIEEAPFVLRTTRNVFTKYYSSEITSMMHWSEGDAKDYWKNMKEVLAYYFKELDKKLSAKKEDK